MELGLPPPCNRSQFMSNNSCFFCPEGQVVSGSGTFCSPSLVCMASQVSVSDGDDDECKICEDCNLLWSIFVVAGQLFSFILASIYVERQSSNRSNLLQLKILTNFFQVASLTHLIDVPLPPLVTFSLPFNLPTGAFTCIMHAIGMSWNYETSFYVFLYVPLYVFHRLFDARGRHMPGSIKHVEISQLVIKAIKAITGFYFLFSVFCPPKPPKTFLSLFSVPLHRCG